MDLSLKVAVFYIITSYLAYIVTFVLYRTWYPSLRNIPGPESPSWLYGNIPQLVFAKCYGDHEFQWQKCIRENVQTEGMPGDKLFTSDPVALKYVFKNNRIFTKGYYHRQLVWMLMGEWSIFRIFHDVHARIRPVLNTAFSQARIQHTFPTLRGVSMRVTDKLEEIIGSNTSNVQVVNIYHLLQHATADVVAEVKENEKRNYSTKLSADELKDQIPTMLIAGQDTTGNSLAFAILELARHPEWQGKIREEILQLQGDLNCSSLDKLVYLNAHIKETLRYHPILPNTERLATEDTFLPLSKPIKTNSGHTLTQLHIKKGQLVTIGLASYNRDPDIWGNDAHCFDPYRWIDERSTKLPGGTSFGPYANIASFIGGPHTCLGWRLALLGMQVILADLVSKFSFEEAGDVVIRPCVAVTMQPVSEKGLPHLPLRVKKRLDHKHDLPNSVTALSSCSVPAYYEINNLKNDFLHIQ
ncbi:hypothetical protein VNI00_015738 [Paramarasmius palmivorus]|uniref:Cytochrome P450 n=1 Tax=Paramarasmius palmivorus TaxID=297713 RepID=A0AAW0BJF3_9AGAR